MTDLYLVAHKCRGKATFSVATRLDIGTESDPAPWWIDSVGGWRVYPYWERNLRAVLFSSVGIEESASVQMPSDARDCFGTQFDRDPRPVQRQPKSSPQDLAGFLS